MLVQGNINTHTPGSYYEAFSLEDAFALAQCFELHFAPTKTSWLNMVKIECLDHRISDIDSLKREAMAWARKRYERNATIQSQFTQVNSRNKFRKSYPGLS